MRVFGLIGRSLTHSFSRRYFTEKFVRLGLADCRYELFELATVAGLPELLASQPGLAGLNVTIPYKEQVQPYLTQLAPSAVRVGAVNVIAFKPGGELVGHNTDYLGFRESLRVFRQGRELGAGALVLGTGGAARAVLAALADLGIDSRQVSRHPGAGQLGYDDLTPAVLAAHLLIVNTTPLGTYPNVAECPPLPYLALTPAHHLYDLVYNPPETEFLRRGAAQGARTHNGLAMLELQADAAWAIWNELPGGNGGPLAQ